MTLPEMEAGNPATEPSRKEMRKQKLMEYLVSKRKQNLPQAKSHPQQRPHGQKLGTSHPQKVVVGKENKVPADGVQSKTWTSQLGQNPPRKTVAVPGKVNQVTKRQPAAGAAPNQKNSVVIRTSSKVGAMAGGSVRTQMNQNLVRFSSKSSLCSAAAPVRPVSARMSVGPCVKTRTGLIPAVLQPKSTNPNPPLTSANPTKTSVRPVGAPSRPVSHKSAAAGQNSIRAVLPKGTSAAGKSRLPSKPIGTASSSNKPELSKPDGRLSTKQPPNPSTAVRPAPKGGKSNQVAPQASSKTSRFSSRPEAAQKTAVRTKTETNKVENPTKAPVQAGSKRVGAPGVSQTAPQPSRNVNLTRRLDAKTSKVTAAPPTGGKKPSSAQEERLRKLQEWREAKGISYKRPPMQVKAPPRRRPAAPPPFWPSMRAEDEARSLICAVDRSLADCIKLLAEGCPPDQVEAVLSRLPPVSQKFAKFWICRARLMEREGNLDVLPLFQEAVRVVVEPVDELRTVVFDILKKKDEQPVLEEDGTEGAESEPLENDPTTTPKRVRVLINEEQGGSSVVKYKITATPGGPPSQHRKSVKVNGQEVRFFTPVRRSVRIEHASLRHPPALQDHDLCVSSYRHLTELEDGEERHSPPSTPIYVYRENEALKDKVFIQLVYDDEP